MKKIRLILADDQLLFLRSLKLVIETSADDIEVIGSASNGHDALKLIKELSPDICLLDVRMPEMDGVEVVKRISEEGLNVKIMMLTTFDDDQYVHQAMEFGAVGYMLKDIPPEELITSIRALSEGAVQLSPEIASKLLRVHTKSSSESVSSRDLTEKLNNRELEILKLITQGLDNKEIAARIFIAEQTVKNYVSSIYSKIGARDRVQAMQIGLKAHL